MATFNHCTLCNKKLGRNQKGNAEKGTMEIWNDMFPKMGTYEPFYQVTIIKDERLYPKRTGLRYCIPCGERIFKINNEKESG